MASSNATFSNFDGRQIDPSAAQAILRAGFSTNTVRTVTIKSGLPGELSVSSSFQNENIKFVYRSGVFNKGDVLSFYSEVRFSKFPEGTEISMPYVSALTKSPISPFMSRLLKVSDIDRFSAIAKEAQGGWIKAQKGLLFPTSNIGIISGERPSFYLVEHPISVRFGSNRFCLSVRSYSALPLNADESFCEK